MMEDREAPMVPETRRRNETTRCADPTTKDCKEENEAFRAETPFVPLVKRSSRVVN